MGRHTLLFALLSALAFAQTDSATIQRAVNGVSRLRSMMKDPESFVLEAAYLKKPNKQGVSEVCYYYRAHNSYGGFAGTGEAVLLKNDHIFIVDSELQANPFFSLADPCRLNVRIDDITAEVVSTLNPSLLTAGQILNAADRPKIVTAENASFKKEGVSGYAEFVGDAYIVHSERANSIRFHANMLGNKEYMVILQRAQVATLIYTNDSDQKFVYDMRSGQIVTPAPADTVAPKN